MNPEWREPNLRERTDGAQFDQCDRGHLRALGSRTGTWTRGK
jgi:hypothetical protein